MRDPEDEDSGVHVGGDAYGGVRVAPRRDRRSARSARSRRRNLIIAGTLSALVLAGSGAAWSLPNYAASRIESVDAGVPGSQSTGAMNILLVGVDRRDDLTRKQQNQLKLGRETGQRTDTMMVIHLSEDHRRVTVVSLPRDTWTAVPGKGDHKINAAYQLGGPKLTTRTVQNATGLTIHHYVEVNVLGFINVVDALEGVTVCTPVAIDDPKTALQLQPGTYTLDGAKALAYARTRATARSDLDRIDRQQQVISALLSQALSGDTLTNPVKLTRFVNTTLGTLRVDDALRGNLLGLADQLKTVSTDDVAFATVPIADVDYRTPTGESAVLWDKPAARELFRRIAADEQLTGPAKTPAASATPAPETGATPSPSATRLTVPPSRISVKVLNGTLVTGLGARTREQLLKAGFLVPEQAGDTQRRDYDKTVIRYGPGREDSARTLAAALPGADVRLIDDLGDTIEVIAGQDRPEVKKVTVEEAAPASSPSAAPSSTPAARTATQNICKK
ncbi:LCP family protein [Planomonospora venezuelensis]|uniref:LCP family protein required for cell wall assembly n=1 Tax=Planomonospora venezuelensis TaxID=1999 RepID=A0A841D179_PLAVE|nr:LCP family protein [Planomonospora venezuelensis]MBB5962158.1 LCP family protein required for cell wall assembly [Planomonospora venezuelensis]GIN00922.1 LytR family transcriptional regulator [Planomonospora venezuelensis]